MSEKREPGWPRLSPILAEETREARHKAREQIAWWDRRAGSIATSETFRREIESLPSESALDEFTRALDLETEAHTGVKDGRKYVKAGRHRAARRRLVDSQLDTLDALDAYGSSQRELLEYSSHVWARKREDLTAAALRIMRTDGYSEREAHAALTIGDGPRAADRHGVEDHEELKRIRERRAEWEAWCRRCLSDSEVRKLELALGLMGTALAAILEADERAKLDRRAAERKAQHKAARVTKSAKHRR